MARGFSSVGLAAVACLAGLASSTPVTAVDCDGATARPLGGASVLRLSLVNQAGADHDSLAASKAEAGDIWARAGLRLVWLDRAVVASPGERIVTIIVRGGLVRRSPPSTTAARVGTPLGWTLFANGAPIGIIEVSLDAITSVVGPASFAGRRVADLPGNLRRHLVGRALGRVVAHEIGHWLGGSTHTSDGLMVQQLSGNALVGQYALAPPPGWITAAIAERLTSHPPCEPEPNAVLP